jgi:hypothetical protein
MPFADYMLPEGAHNRVEDWTYMVLRRAGPQIDEVRTFYSYKIYMM